MPAAAIVPLNALASMLYKPATAAGVCSAPTKSSAMLHLPSMGRS